MISPVIAHLARKFRPGVRANGGYTWRFPQEYRDAYSGLTLGGVHEIMVVWTVVAMHTPQLSRVSARIERDWAEARSMGLPELRAHYGLKSDDEALTAWAPVFERRELPLIGKRGPT